MEEYVTRGVCSRKISFNIENGILYDVSFQGGCDGNLQAVCKLVQGMRVEEVIEKLKGIDCRGKGTSCPDQLAKALEAAIKSGKHEIAI